MEKAVSAVQFRDDEKWPVWLVWSLHENGSISLRAVTTSKEKANIYRKITLPAGFVRAWVEPSETNHLYGHNDALLSKFILQQKGKLLEVEE